MQQIFKKLHHLLYARKKVKLLELACEPLVKKIRLQISPRSVDILLGSYKCSLFVMFFQAAARDASQLYTAIDRRIQTLKRDQASNQPNSEETEESTETTEKSSEAKEADNDDTEKGKNGNISNEDTEASSK